MELKEIKLARASVGAKPKVVSLKKLEEDALGENQGFFYLDKENTHKQVLSLVQSFEKKGLSVYHKKVKYGLDEDDYMYEVHIL
jgi:hypothetical protein